MKALVQPLLFCTQHVVIPCIQFNCAVNGQDLAATVTHKEDSGGHARYRVLFSDGHGDSYLPGDQTLQDRFGRKRQMDAYEEAIYDDLCVVPLLHKGDGFTCVSVEERGGERFNVWIRKRKGFYSAFYKGCYQFTLCKTGREWVVSTAREKGYVTNLPLARFLSEKMAEHPF